MPVEIPINTGDEITDAFEIALDGRPYRFAVFWNARAASWHMTVADGAGAELVAGVRVCADWRLTVPGLPGGLVVVDTTGKSLDPGLDDLGVGKRVQILYFEAGE